MIDKIAINKQESIDLTKGEQKRDFIYVDDVVSAYLKVLEFTKNSDFSFKSFDVGCGVAVSLKDFASAIKEISNSPTKLNFGALSYREDEIVCSKADIAELTKLGRQPKYSYKDGLKKYIKEF